MIRFIKTFIIIIFIFTMTLCFTETISNDDDFYKEVYLYAKTLSDNNLNKEASLEYKRYIFLQQYLEGTYEVESLKWLVNFYENEKDFRAALDYEQRLLKKLDVLENEFTAEYVYELKKEIFIIQQLFSDYLLNSGFEKDEYINMSLIRLNTLAYSEEMPEEIRVQAFCSLIIYEVQNGDWHNADIVLNNLFVLFPNLFIDEEKNPIERIISDAEKFTLKKPMSAAYLSIIPGVGQIYATDYKDALNAFILNGSIFAVSFYSLINLNFTDFFVFEMNPLYRFYRGNMYNAQRDVYKYNNRAVTEYKKKIIEIISQCKDN